MDGRGSSRADDRREHAYASRGGRRDRSSSPRPASGRDRSRDRSRGRSDRSRYAHHDDHFDRRPRQDGDRDAYSAWSGGQKRSSRDRDDRRGHDARRNDEPSREPKSRDAPRAEQQYESTSSRRQEERHNSSPRLRNADRASSRERRPVPPRATEPRAQESHRHSERQASPRREDRRRSPARRPSRDPPSRVHDVEKSHPETRQRRQGTASDTKPAEPTRRRDDEHKPREAVDPSSAVKEAPRDRRHKDADEKKLVKRPVPATVYDESSEAYWKKHHEANRMDIKWLVWQADADISGFMADFAAQELANISQRIQSHEHQLAQWERGDDLPDLPTL